MPKGMKRGAAAMLIAATMLAGASQSASAQSYPDRPIKIVVPVGPAGSYDLVGRVLADQFSKRMGQSVVVENRPGAGMLPGTMAVVSAPPDGYTLLIAGLGNIVFNVGLYKKLGYDPLNDLVPVALVFNVSYTLVASKASNYKSVKDVIEAAKKNPGGVTMAHQGVGTGPHLLGAAFQKFTGVKFTEVAYRGSAAAYPDVLAGRVNVFFDSTPAAIPYVKSGQVDGLAILGPSRNQQIPQVPRMSEVGVSGLDINSWVGLFAPAKTPPEVIARLQKEIAAAMPELKQRFAAAGGEPMELDSQAMQKLIKSDYDTWLKVIRDANISLD